MKFFLLLLLSVFMAESITLVGVSGRSYTLESLERDGEIFVKPREIAEILNFPNSTSGSSFSLNLSSGTGRVDFRADTIYFQNENLPLQIPARIRRGEGFLALGDLLLFFNKLSTFNFSYLENSNSIRVSNQLSPLRDESVRGVIVIDPGHGGRDPGAIGPRGTYEKDVVLAISKELVSYLRARTALDIRMTRDDDTFVPLGDRIGLANSIEADLFISMHADASPKGNDIEGYRIYFLSDALNKSDAAIAERENASLRFEKQSSDQGGDFLQSILQDLQRTEYIRESQELAFTSIDRISRGVPYVNRLHTGVGQANFFVLRGAQMPAILVEAAFITNEREELLLLDPVFQRDFASSLGEGIVDFLIRYGSISDR